MRFAARRRQFSARLRDPLGASARLALQTIDDARLREIVGRHLQLHAVARGEADEALAHAARDVCEHEVLIGQLYAEHGSGEDRSNSSLDFNDIVLDRHVVFLGAPREAVRMMVGDRGRAGLQELSVKRSGWLVCQSKGRDSRRFPRERKSFRGPPFRADSDRDPGHCGYCVDRVVVFCRGRSAPLKAIAAMRVESRKSGKAFDSCEWVLKISDERRGAEVDGESRRGKATNSSALLSHSLRASALEIRAFITENGVSVCSVE